MKTRFFKSILAVFGSFAMLFLCCTDFAPLEFPSMEELEQMEGRSSSSSSFAELSYSSSEIEVFSSSSAESSSSEEISSSSDVELSSSSDISSSAQSSSSAQQSSSSEIPSSSSEKSSSSSVVSSSSSAAPIEPSSSSVALPSSSSTDMSSSSSVVSSSSWALSGAVTSSSSGITLLQCSTGTYNPQTHFCLNGNTPTILCGGKEYADYEFCYSNQIYGKCNGSYNPTTIGCCDNAQYILTRYGCCNDVRYERDTHFCHNNKIANFCGSNPQEYNPDEYGCKDGKNGIYLKNGITDYRDNRKHYDAVLIGNQTWMAENLNFNAEGSKCGDGSYLSGDDTSTCTIGYLSGDDTPTCTTYGRLYNWATAMANSASSTANPSGVQGVCPDGWHLPSNAEWNALMKTINSSCSDNTNCAGAGKILKAISGWNRGGDGTDVFGFAALPGGIGMSDDFLCAGYAGHWLSSSEYDAISSDALNMEYGYEYTIWNGYDKDYFFSVRCLQN